MLTNAKEIIFIDQKQWTGHEEHCIGKYRTGYIYVDFSVTVY